MISEADFKELSHIVGKENLITTQDALAEYASDATKLEYMPDAVALPKNSKEVSLILRLATKKDSLLSREGRGAV